MHPPSITAKCAYCLRLRPLDELLVVRDTLTGETFGVCRPGLLEARAADCFRSVGERARYAIAPADPTKPGVPAA